MFRMPKRCFEIIIINFFNTNNLTPLYVIFENITIIADSIWKRCTQWSVLLTINTKTSKAFHNVPISEAVTEFGYTPLLEIPLISLWLWVARRPYKVLSVISTNIAWQTHLGFDRGLTIDLESYGTEFDTIVILETLFHENNNIFISHSDKHKRSWKNRFYNKCNLYTHTN